MANTKANNALNILIYRQKTQLPFALKELNKYGKKTSHWSWWAFPTEMSGGSEPPIKLDNIPRGKSFVTITTAKKLIESAPISWYLVLSKICELIENTSKLESVLPKIDHDRVRYFIKFWNTIDNKPDWLTNVISRLYKKLK